MIESLSEPSPSTIIYGPDFDNMTKAGLLDYAAENGIEGVSDSMKKADILAAIKGEV